MSHLRYSILTFSLFVGLTAPARADDAADARALVEKAVKAHGGQDKLEKLTGQAITFKGTFHGMGQKIPMTGQISSQGKDRSKVDLEFEAGGMKFRIINVFAGDKGWTKLNDETKELDKDQITEAVEQAHAGWVATLAPLKDKQFTLATIGEMEINKRPALGVKVTFKGRRDVDLYFDKATGLLASWETRIKDEGSGQEVSQESFMDDYKEVKGTKQAMKFTIKRDGKLFVEGEASEIQLLEKLDDTVFAKP